MRIASLLFIGIVASSAMWMLLPQGIIVINDDFGYLRSVSSTATKIRPWTDDWLEPWSASLSAISALLFKATGSFQLATQGLQSFLWGATAAGLTWCLRIREYSRWQALLLTISICLIPTLLWKGLEFTAMIVYTPCLILAIGAAMQNRWIMFTAFTCTALASRQSAITWFAVPLLSIAQNFIRFPRDKPKLLWAPMWACVTGIACWLGLQLVMNKTHAQRVMTSKVWDSFQLGSFFERAGFAILLILACSGVANTMRWLAGLPCHQWKRHSTTPVILRGVIPVLAMIALTFTHSIDIQREHDLYESAGRVFGGYGWVIVASFGWLIVPIKIDLRLLSGALISAILVSVRAITWDYYWIDTALFAFFAVSGRRFDEQPDSTDPSKSADYPLVRNLTYCCFLGFLIISAKGWINRAKNVVDDYRAKEVILEQSLRQNEISPSELSIAPFGFQAWHLFPYFITTKEGEKDYIANFKNYLGEDSLAWETRGVNNPTPIPNPETIVRTGIFSVGWGREQHQFILRRQRHATEALINIASDRYIFEPFPLNEAEWQQQLFKR